MKKFGLQLILFIICYSFNQIFAQDIETISKAKAFSISGSLYVGANGYTNFSSDPSRRSPYSYTLLGAPIVTIYGISLPFSFAFSDQQFSYSQPFNIYGVSPSYKWAQLHLGYRSMNFSSFTLSGKQFYGAGIELNPGKIKISALYGKLKDLYAQHDTLTYGSHVLDTYDRTINGVKIGYGNKNSFEFIYVKVKDRENSSTVKTADNTYLLPEDNFVLGIETRFYIFRYCNLYLETAASLHTSDLQAEIEIDDDKIQKLTNSLSSIIKINASTRWGFAGKTGIQFNYNNIGLGVNYLRVDPFFKSLGLYYMNTDYENYTGNLELKLIKSRLRIGITGGFQQNNLSQLKQQTDLKKIGSLNISYFSQNGLSLIANYSNYQSDQTAGYIKIEDSLKLALVNEMALFTPGYSWENGNLNHSVNANFSFQKFKDINKFHTISLIDDHNYTIALDYGISHIPSKTNFNVGANYFLLSSSEANEKQIGISLGANKSVLNKALNIRLNTYWNKNIYNGAGDGHSMSLRNSLTYNISKKQNISFNIIWINRTGEHRRNINEIRSGLNYGLSF